MYRRVLVPRPTPVLSKPERLGKRKEELERRPELITRVLIAYERLTSEVGYNSPKRGLGRARATVSVEYEERKRS